MGSVGMVCDQLPVRSRTCQARYLAIAAVKDFNPYFLNSSTLYTSFLIIHYSWNESIYPSNIYIPEGIEIITPFLKLFLNLFVRQ